jgi:hypothetical protein
VVQTPRHPLCAALDATERVRIFCVTIVTARLLPPKTPVFSDGCEVTKPVWICVTAASPGSSPSSVTNAVTMDNGTWVTLKPL